MASPPKSITSQEEVAATRGTMAAMTRDRFVWMLRLVWAVQPITSGSAFALALDSASRPVAITATIGLWVLWAIALAAAMTPLPISLAVVRVIMPAAPVALLAAIAAIDAPGAHRAAIIISVIATTTAAGIALSAPVGDRFVDGASYGDERRMLLRPSVVVLAGPVIVAWGVAAAGMILGPLLLAARHWWWGAAAIVVGVPLGLLAFRALYSLTQRWAVFVPAGIVLRDPITLAEPVLFRRDGIAFIGPALTTSEADDLTAGASGLALEMRLVANTALPIKDGSLPRSAPISPTTVDSVLIAPSRPGALLEEAARRGVRVR